MIYEIEGKNDILSGSALIVRIPEEDLDRKALYTIEEDMPGFILPFRHRAVNRQIEFVYQIGTHSKLHYLAGDRYPKEYAQLWSSLLCPLLECGDWFLKPFSFVLDINHLYCDKNENCVRYVYIPSIRDCSGYGDLKAMAAEFSRQITVTSADLENKVLRAIMMDFNPKSFLQMLKADAAVSEPVVCLPSAQQKRSYGTVTLPVTDRNNARLHDANAPEICSRQPQASMPLSSEEIIIEIPLGHTGWKKAKEKSNNNEAMSEKKQKQQKNRKIANIWPRSKPEDRRNALFEPGLVANAAADGPMPQQPETFLPITSTGAQISVQPDITQSISYEPGGSYFRLIGNARLPAGIDVVIAEGEVFTVGRHDIAAGRKLSSFEFDRMTKAISRRHAAIERNSDGYNLIDLASSAGTYIDDQKLPPNTPCKLHPGCRVSFGNCGADYVWEQ